MLSLRGEGTIDQKFAAQAPCFSYGVSGAVVGFYRINNHYMV